MSIHGLKAKDFSELSRAALTDDVQRGAIGKATNTIRERRGSAVESMPEWEEMRERARAIKAHTLARLDHYLEEFTSRAEQAGVVIHWAQDAEEAGEIIAGLIPEGCDKPIAKAKSMVSEEIGLNHLLESRGLRPVETDLGEWIQQMAGEPPSHIIVPAIHKTQQQIADLFAEKLGSKADASAEELTAIARKILREEFANAEVGITGVNFAVAETGSFLLLENEGNIRLTTTLPRIHIAVMGIEKLLPRLSDLEVFLRLLPRSGTGQHLTSYQTIFTGNAHRQNDETESSENLPVVENRNAGECKEVGEGPEQIHLVLLDNGRSKLLGDELTQSSLQCIRCGACLNVCPVYRQIGGHAYGSVYPGPIGSVITPQLAGVEQARPLPFASSLCGACKDVCPVKIDLPELLLDLRKQASQSGSKSESLGFSGWAWFMKSSRRYMMSLRLARLFFPLGKNIGPFRKWRAGRELPNLAAKSFREQWAANGGQVSGGSSTVGRGTGRNGNQGNGNSPSAKSSEEQK